MNLYLLSQDENNTWDTYDSILVAADSEDEARQIHPNYDTRLDAEYQKSLWGDVYAGWCKSPNAVKVTKIGVANDDQQKAIIIQSFNAG